MAETVEQITNMALGHLGISKEMVDFDTDTTKEAAACRLFYAQARDECLRDFPWAWATRVEELTQDQTTPNDEWTYSYDLPSDIIRISRIFSGFRPETAYARVPFRVVSDGSAAQLHTNQADAVLEYIEKVTDVEMFPPDFVQMLSLLLASYIAPRVAGGDDFKLGDKALQKYEWARNRAWANAANEQQSEEPADSSFITIRS